MKCIHYSWTMLPDQDIFGLQVRNYLSTKLAEVLGVLTDLHLLNLFPQTGTVPSAWSTEVCSTWERKTPLQVHSPRGNIPHTFRKVRDKFVTCQKSTLKQTRKKPQNGNHHICQQFQLFWCVSSAMQPDRANSSQLSDSASTAWELHTRYVIAFETLDETGLGFNSVPLYQKAWTTEKGTNTIIERKKEWGNKTGKKEKIKEQENRRVEKARRQKNVP
jgi:hypothetical protein